MATSPSEKAATLDRRVGRSDARHKGDGWKARRLGKVWSMSPGGPSRDCDPRSISELFLVGLWLTYTA